MKSPATLKGLVSKTKSARGNLVAMRWCKDSTSSCLLRTLQKKYCNQLIDHPPVIETWLAGKSPSMIFPQKNSIFIWDFWTSSKPLRAMDPPVFHLHQQGQRHFPLPPFLTCADPDDMKADAQRVSVAFPGWIPSGAVWRCQLKCKRCDVPTCAGSSVLPFFHTFGTSYTFPKTVGRTYDFCDFSCRVRGPKRSSCAFATPFFLGSHL